VPHHSSSFATSEAALWYAYWTIDLDANVEGTKRFSALTLSELPSDFVLARALRSSDAHSLNVSHFFAPLLSRADAASGSVAALLQCYLWAICVSGLSDLTATSVVRRCKRKVCRYPSWRCAQNSEFVQVCLTMYNYYMENFFSYRYPLHLIPSPCTSSSFFGSSCSLFFSPSAVRSQFPIPPSFHK